MGNFISIIPKTRPVPESAGMERKWVARPYRYADGVPWNQDRYEIFVLTAEGMVSVGGAIRSWSHRTVAFLCPKEVQRKIRTPQDAETRTEGLYVVGASVKEALSQLKWRWPNPDHTLSRLAQTQQAIFQLTERKRPQPATAPAKKQTRRKRS